MSRKVTTRALLAGLGALLLVALSGCVFDLFSVSISERIALFEDELNASDRSDTYTMFHPVETQDYEAIRPAESWEIDFPLVGSGDTAYTIEITTADPKATPDDVEGTINGPAGFGGLKNIKFVMAKYDFDWVIKALYLNGNPIVD